MRLELTGFFIGIIFTVETSSLKLPRLLTEYPLEKREIFLTSTLILFQQQLYMYNNCLYDNRHPKIAWLKSRVQTT